MIDLDKSGAPHSGSVCPASLAALPVPAYTCDREGVLTAVNPAAERLWNGAPPLNDPSKKWCGSHRLYTPDGAFMPHSECWAALAVHENRPYNGRGVIVEHPDGSRAERIVYANPVHDDSGARSGIVNALVERASTASRTVPVDAGRAFRDALTRVIETAAGQPARLESELAPLIALCRIGVSPAGAAENDVVPAEGDVSEATAFTDALRFARDAIAGALPDVSLAAADSPPATDRLRIMIVDDHAQLREQIILLINNEDDMQVVAEAGNGEEGVRLVREFWPNAVIMDYSMPGIKGDAATKKILSSMHGVAVVALSLHNDDRIRANMRDAGAADFVLKSDVNRSLTGTIRNAARQIAA